MTHPSERLAAGVVDALIGVGVCDIVYCPGSRSAPFAYALDTACRAGRVRAHVRLDERSAAFLAIGLSKAGQGVPHASTAHPEPVPVAVIMTSGTAVAETHAAVAEAHHSRLPLIVVSADRPFEMLAVGASQTTFQSGIFGPHTPPTCDIPADTEPGRELGAKIARVVARACGRPTGQAGPAHIDVSLRDPLTPEGGSVRSSAYGAAFSFDPALIPAAAPQPASWCDVVEEDALSVIIAADGACADASSWARGAKCPILAEPSSGLAWDGFRIPFQQSLLSSPLADEIEQVIVTGRPTLSRSVSALLARPDVRVVIVDPDPAWADASGTADVVVGALAAPTTRPADSDGGCGAEVGGSWLGRWREAARLADKRITRICDSSDLSVLHVARAVWQADDKDLLLGASNSVRACDLVGHGGAPRRVWSNRGLAGIDGTVATAIGLALGIGRPLSALMGDLTFFHDAGALAIPASESAPDLTIIVADDAGGSIFASLEHGRRENASTFDRWFATRQRTSIEYLARAYGVGYRRIEDEESLRSALVEPSWGIRILHVICTLPDEIVSVRNVLHEHE